MLNRRGFNYSGKLTQEEIADNLAVACGYLGSGAEYLLNTVAHLEERGTTTAGSGSCRKWWRSASPRAGRNRRAADASRAMRRE